MNDETVAHEISLLQAEVMKLGTRDPTTGKVSVPFGVLFQETQDIFESLGGTLKAAKKRGIVSYDAPILLKGAVRNLALDVFLEALLPFSHLLHLTPLPAARQNRHCSLSRSSINVKKVKPIQILYFL